MSLPLGWRGNNQYISFMSDNDAAHPQFNIVARYCKIQGKVFNIDLFNLSYFLRDLDDKRTSARGITVVIIQLPYP